MTVTEATSVTLIATPDGVSCTEVLVETCDTTSEPSPVVPIVVLLMTECWSALRVSPNVSADEESAIEETLVDELDDGESEAPTPEPLGDSSKLDKTIRF